uniref:AlNc14C439G11654 protein n=1 Tax=Albugo laibachii Nc14 TaxID=890382 RepID=F0WZR3_9STRA|nr:AlNc14C439G11654 [Albugo laibachii Nc14]|eukprot:CCA26990.1 AlNc14C439G11654 [Albugo laibachii Nc14]
MQSRSGAVNAFLPSKSFLLFFFELQSRPLSSQLTQKITFDVFFVLAPVRDTFSVTVVS